MMTSRCSGLSENSYKAGLSDDRRRKGNRQRKATKQQEMDKSESNTPVEDVSTNTLHEDRETAETRQGEQLLNGEGQSQPFESHLGDETEIPPVEHEKDTCTCSGDPTVNTAQRATSEQTHCHLCGKLTRQSSETHSLGGLPGPSVLSPSETGRAFADGLHFTPSSAEAFHDGNNQSTSGPSTKNTTAQNDPAADEGGCKKNAVEGVMSPTTVQVPSRARQWTFFTLVENHPALNEKWFSIYFFPSQRYEDETYQTMEDLQRSIDLNNVVPSAREDENTGLERSQHFHNIFMEGHARLTITFRLLERRPGRFRMRVQLVANEILTATVLSLSQGRFPSPTARLFVKYLGAPGELCQGDIIMTIYFGETLTHIMPIWDSPDVKTSSRLPTAASSLWKTVRMYKCQKIISRTTAELQDCQVELSFKSYIQPTLSCAAISFWCLKK